MFMTDAVGAYVEDVALNFSIRRNTTLSYSTAALGQQYPQVSGRGRQPFEVCIGAFTLLFEYGAYLIESLLRFLHLQRLPLVGPRSCIHDHIVDEHLKDFLDDLRDGLFPTETPYRRPVGPTQDKHVLLLLLL